MRLLGGYHAGAIVITGLLCIQTASGQALSAAITTPEGLRIEDLGHVECTRRSQNGDMIHVHYAGTLEDGTVFDSSYKRNSPFAFRLGGGRVIKGWDLGLLDMCIGDERRLIIPPDLGYGSRGIGAIPGGAVLYFETKLMAIDGVPDDQQPIQPPIPSLTPPPVPTTSVPTVPSSTAPAPTSPPDSQNPGEQPGAENGECRLLGPFALVVQSALGAIALLSLVLKRYRERPRRPVKIWFFDASKQVFGSVLLHILNLLMSMVSSDDLMIIHTAKEFTAQLVDADGHRPNPCSFYLMNLAVDTTIGIPILVIMLKLLTHAFSLTPLARPAESIRSGHYGQPAHVTWWLKQSLIYFLGLLLMKLCVFFLFQILPWIAWVGDWALRWTEGSEALQIAFVMFIFPVIMNGLQYYIIDSFIKDPAGGEGHERLATSDRSSDDPRDSDDGSDDGYTTGAGAEDEEAAKRSADVRTKEMKVDEAGSKSPDRGVYEVEEGRGSDQNSVAESSKAK